MALKRSAAKGKVDDAAVGETEVHGWKTGKCADSHLLNLVESHLLQPRKLIHWRHYDGESFPYEGKDKSVVFLPQFFEASVFPFSICSGVFLTTGEFKFIT